MEKKKFFNTRALVTASLFIALSIVFTRLFSIRITDVQRLGFGQTPIILAGILLGPIWGLLVGALSDVLGYLIAPLGGAYIPGLTLVAALIGFIPGLFRKYIFKKSLVAAVIVSVLVDLLVVNGLLTTYFLSIVYSSKTFTARLIARMPMELLMLPIQVFLCTALGDALASTVFKQKKQSVDANEEISDKTEEETIKE